MLTAHFKTFAKSLFVVVLFCFQLKAQVSLPTSINTLKLWLASDSGVVQTGGKVSTWNDISGNNNNAISVSGVNNPIFISSSLNGRPSLKFNGLEGLQIPNVSLGAKGCSVFIVAKVATKTSYGMFLTYGINSSGTWNMREVDNTGRFSFVNGQTNSGAGATSAASPIGTTNDLEGAGYNMLYGEVNSNLGNWSIYENGILKDMRNEVFNQSVTESIYLGVRGDLVGFLNGEILEVIIYDTTISALNRVKVENYLHNKYTAPVSLGPDKIVCSFPVTLKAKRDYFNDYLWQDGSTADSLVINSPGIYSIKTTDVFEKVSNDTISIMQDGLNYEVKLGKDTTICSGQELILNAGASRYKYLWSNASATDSIIVNSTGTYWVSVIDCLGNISKDTINVTVIPLPTFNLGFDRIACFNTANVLDPGFLNSVNYSFLWSTGSVDSILSITHSDTYWLGVVDGVGCTYSDTVNIQIDSLLSNVSLGADISLCSGNSIYLKSGAAQAANYLWNDNSTNDSLTVTTSGQYFLTVSNANSCTKTDTININITGSAPTASFSSNTTCIGNATNFTDLSVPPGGNTIATWLWNFGNPSSGANNISTLQNPIHIYADTGSYTVKLIVTTNAGCAAVISKIIKVYPNPQISFTSTNLCENSNAQFTGQALTFGYPITQWNWNFGNPASAANNISGLQNPIHIFVGAATYTVQLIAQNTYGCKDTASQNIVIGQLPVADFNNTVACKNSSVQFTDKSILPPSTTVQSTTWNFGDSGNSILLNPSHIYSANVNYNVTHIISASNGCKDTIAKTINVFPAPYAYFSANNICLNDSGYFNDLSVGQGGILSKWLWDFGSGNTSTIQNTKYIYTSVGNKNVKLLVTTTQGCKDSITKTVVVNPLPIANFTFTPAIGTIPLLVNFTNTSSGATSYVWDFGDTTQSINTNPSHTFLSAITYSISLTAKNNFGCGNVIVKTISPLVEYLDVAMLDVATSIQDNFLTITVKIANTGNTDVTKMELYVNVKEGSVIKENWSGLLKAGSIITYQLNTSIYLDDEKDYVCVSALAPNGIEDVVAENNKLCKVLDETIFKVLDVYPNPSKDVITVPFILPDEKFITITIYDINGTIVKNAYSGYLPKGLQEVVINTVELNSGMYACKIINENQTVIKTFIKY